MYAVTNECFPNHAHIRIQVVFWDVLVGRMSQPWGGYEDEVARVLWLQRQWELAENRWNGRLYRLRIMETWLRREIDNHRQAVRERIASLQEVQAELLRMGQEVDSHQRYSDPGWYDPSGGALPPASAGTVQRNLRDSAQALVQRGSSSSRSGEARAAVLAILDRMHEQQQHQEEQEEQQQQGELLGALLGAVATAAGATATGRGSTTLDWLGGAEEQTEEEAAGMDQTGGLVWFR